MGLMVAVGRAIEEYVDGRVARQEIAKETARNFREHLRLFATYIGHDKQLRAVSHEDVLAWLASMVVASATLRVRISTLRMFFQWALSSVKIRSDPMVGIKAPRKPRTVPRGLSTREVKAALASCADSRERLILVLMVQEGLRAMEVANLEMGDFDFAAMTVVVNGKGGHQRTLPLSDETAWVMEDYLRERGRSSGFLIRSYQRSYASSTDGLSRKYVARLASQALHRAGIDESGHALRHTMAHGMIAEGANLRDVQNALGHASLMTTQIYLPITAVSELRRKMGKRRYLDSEIEEVAVQPRKIAREVIAHVLPEADAIGA